MEWDVRHPCDRVLEVSQMDVVQFQDPYKVRCTIERSRSNATGALRCESAVNAAMIG